jgi:hypothetical protein
VDDNQLYMISAYKNVEDLKWKVANDPQLTVALASFAHMLGFGWCGGTRSPSVGQDFEVSKQDDNYLLSAHYGADDAYSAGYWANNRLQITLSNFRFGLTASSFKFSEPIINELEPIGVGSHVAYNYSSTTDLATIQFTYQLSDAVTHMFGFSFGQGLKAGGKLKLPFVAEGAVEINLSAAETCSDSATTTYSKQQTATYAANLPAHTSRVISLLASRTKSDIKYTAIALVGFDIKFVGFLRYTGNAKADHPTGRPSVTLKFGNGKYNGLENIQNKWNNREIRVLGGLGLGMGV